MPEQPATDQPGSDGGYRLAPIGGPQIRSDVVDVYVFQRSVRPPAPVFEPDGRGGRRDASRMDSAGADAGQPPRAEVWFLQLLRSGPPLAQTWHPVMGHCEAGETAVQCMKRELREELGLEAGAPALLGLWALEQVHPFFIAEIDSIVMSPRFAAEVAPGWTPRLDDEHSAHRWVRWRDAAAAFMWPGQLAACREVVESLLPEGSLMRERVRV